MQMITIETKKVKELSKSHIDLMNKWRKKEFGHQEVKNFKKDYLPGATFFFVKDGKKIMSFGTLRNITINYLGKKHKMLGFCNIIVIKKGLEYGRILIAAMMNYLKKKDKTGLGFCSRDKSLFYEKVGLNIEKDFTSRFIYRNPITKEEKIDEEGGDGIYYNGKDNFIKKVLSTKSRVYYYLRGINTPHW